ncbi:hypothetical protein OOU_Y34scaffold00793g19 [Pyricularia oryzae Y34]|uniref:Uncharacterized protein n=2 Tax=Pyricularia oryzae TaxID=318829 RepID=A0AA97NPY1_PYRO3|nr:hypothetical protein OOU_Y34scaffold00793g19 [Pyricularia oryzae Y34]
MPFTEYGMRRFAHPAGKVASYNYENELGEPRNQTLQ